MFAARVATAGSCACLAVAAALALPAAPQADGRRMSLHNRLLLNRAAVGHAREIQIMLAVADGETGSVRELVAQVGGRVEYSAPDVDYLRVRVPLDRAVSFVADDRIAAYQISSRSKAGWDRDGPTEVNATMFHGYERTAVGGTGAPARQLTLPALTIERSREPGYTADDDAGLGEWMREHPTFDGRGVTIAVMEIGQVEFSHPAFRHARDIAGREVPKLAGIVNAIGLDEPDETRVDLDVAVPAASTWQWIGDRTYILPRAGSYRFGMFLLPAADNLTHRFAVLRDDATGSVWVDTDGDTNFQEETPIEDVNVRVDVRTLKLTHPRPANLDFVMARARSERAVHVYVARSDHNSMTASVAAGSRNDDSLAHGVAPGARVLLVRSDAFPLRFHTWIEGYLETMARPDVDVLTDSTITHLAPDTAADFAGLMFRRIAAVYSKPIFHAAGNAQLRLMDAAALGDGFSVGGSLGARTFAALYGGAPLDTVMLHHGGASGPSLDGRIKPDFLAPVHRIAASRWSATFDGRIPANAPDLELPHGYGISCCTSASAPYAAGVAAVLISAARQTGLRYPYERFARALRSRARFLDGFPAHQQGNGVLDVNAAWQELNDGTPLPRIRSSTTVVHPMAQYAARGPEGEGIFEYEGWSPGTAGRREIRFRRESGPGAVVRYNVSWTGNDGTFHAPQTIALPLNAWVALPITIAARHEGAHSALLNVRDERTGSIVFRTQATIVVANRFDPRTRTLRVAGTVPFMRHTAHFITVPPGAAAISVQLEVTRGSLTIGITPSDGLNRGGYYSHVYPQNSRTFTPGKYTVVLPDPAPGTWRIDVANVSARAERDRALVSFGEASYHATLGLAGAALRALTNAKGLAVDVENPGPELREPTIDASAGSSGVHRGTFLPTGLPNLIHIDVPPGMQTLRVNVRRDRLDGSALELHLYDCTAGECFSHDFTLAAEAHRMVVRKPKPGRWVAAVNAAPYPTAPGGFVLEEMVAAPGERHRAPSDVPRGPGSRWRQTIDAPAATQPAGARTPILLLELLDLALLRDEAQDVWETRDYRSRFRQSPAALGFTVFTLQ